MRRSSAIVLLLIATACSSTGQTARARFYAVQTWNTLDKSFTAWAEAGAERIVEIARAGDKEKAQARADRLAEAIELWEPLSAATVIALSAWISGEPEPPDVAALLGQASQLAAKYGVIK